MTQLSFNPDNLTIYKDLTLYNFSIQNSPDSFNKCVIKIYASVCEKNSDVDLETGFFSFKPSPEIKLIFEGTIEELLILLNQGQSEEDVNSNISTVKNFYKFLTSVFNNLTESLLNLNGITIKPVITYEE